MSPFLVTATDRSGHRDSFVREAESLPHLRAVLEREGFSDIEYLDDEYSARLRKETPAAFRDESPAGARQEAKSRREGHSDGRWVRAIRGNWILILIDLGLIGYGVLAARPWSILVGAGFLLWWVWTVRTAMAKSDDYNALLRAQAAGDQAACLRLIERMSGDPGLASNPLLQTDLGFRRAGLKAREGDLATALAEVQSLRTNAGMANGGFEARIGGLHYQAGDMTGYLHSMEASYEASGRAASNQLDLAFGHARVGDAQRARELLAGVDIRLMPPFHVPLAIAAEGVLPEREGERSAAVDKLGQAAARMEEFSGNVPIWPFLGIIRARYVAALARAGRRDEARAALQPWREVALNCTDPDTRRFLESEVVN